MNQSTDRSVLILDFDRVLFDTEAYILGLREVAKGFGVSRQVWQTAYKQRGADGLFRLSHLAEVLAAKTNQAAEPILRAFEAETADGVWYLHADARPFLEHVAPVSQLYLLTLGDEAVQRQKLVGTGISEHFQDTFIVQEPKAQASVAPLSSVSQAVFINDNIAEMLEVAQKYRWARHIHINRAGQELPPNFSIPSFPNLQAAEPAVLGLLKPTPKTAETEI